MRCTISAEGTTSSMRQPLVVPTSMNSMNRTILPVPLKRLAISTMSWSFVPRLTTMFIFTGARPAAVATSIASSTLATGKSASFIARKVASLSESSETVMRFKPAALSAAALVFSAEPLVVSVKSMPGIALNRAIKFSIPRRNNGSPPVKRIFITPRLTAMPAMRVISSKVSNSSCGKNG